MNGGMNENAAEHRNSNAAEHRNSNAAEHRNKNMNSGLSESGKQ
jgi:hypothetical protein